MIALPMAPAERAERLTGRASLSFSSITTYQSCPLKWYFLCGPPHKKCYMAIVVMWRSSTCPGNL